MYTDNLATVASSHCDKIAILHRVALSKKSSVIDFCAAIKLALVREIVELFMIEIISLARCATILYCIVQLATADSVD
jgi:hypothetical protein